MTTETIQLTVSDGSEMQAYVARPREAAGKGIIVIQEAFGVNDYIKRMTDRFANQEYLAIAPELFHRTAPKGYERPYGGFDRSHMEALTDDGQIADLKASFDWLVANGASESKIAVIGFCMGGRAAFLANATLPVKASVSFYGGGIAQTLLSRAADLRAPQLLMWGGQDAHILPEHTRAVADALKTAGKPFVDVTFADAGHGFACDARDAYHAPSAREAWALADAFLAEHLI